MYVQVMRAFITGLTGQDGSYLAEFLLDKGYEVAGLVRRTSTPSFGRIAHIQNDIELFEGDLTDDKSIREAIWAFEPTEVYHLGAQSFVGTSWGQPVATAEATAISTLRVLEAVRELNECSANTTARFYQASSSEQFGKVNESPQSETTVFHPRSPYGVAKCFSHHATVNYRESYGMHASCGILFNHESPRRGFEFVTRKITHGVASIYCGLTDELELGNLDSRRDWGHARDYVRAMWLMLQQEEPDDYVISTGVTRTIEDLLTVAFRAINKHWPHHVVQNSKFLRPAEVQLLLGDSTKAKNKLGWIPEISFEEMILEMVQNDIALLEGKNAIKTV